VKYFLAVLAIFLARLAFADLLPMDEVALANVSGQALIDTTRHVGDGTSANGTTGITFYTMGLDAQMAMNANINHLQLGCGGANGAGACDIDIQNFSLSGQPGTAGCPSTTTVAGCDAIFTRPSITLAITGDATPFRQVVGFQLSAQKLLGEMTAGVNDGTQNGINNLSGYFVTAATTGTTQTAADSLNAATNVVNGKADFSGCIAGCPTAFHTTGGTAVIPAVSGVTFSVPSFSYYGCRSGCAGGNTSASIGGITSVIPDIALSDAGPLSANIPGCVLAVIIPLCNININSIGLTGTVHHLNANISLSEDLGYLHAIPLNNPFSLSFENQSVSWPGGSVANPSTRGWFMSVADPVNLGSLSTPAGYSADISGSNANVASVLSSYFNANPLQLTFLQAAGGIVGAHINVNVGTLDFTSYSAVGIALTNLPLGTSQTPVPNCYGSYKFC
jgi:hypothetical protein